MIESPAWHLKSCKRQALRVLPLILSQQQEPVTDCRLLDPHHTPYTHPRVSFLCPCPASVLPTSLYYISHSLWWGPIGWPASSFLFPYSPITCSWTLTLPTGSPPVLPSAHCHGALLWYSLFSEENESFHLFISRLSFLPVTGKERLPICHVSIVPNCQCALKGASKSLYLVEELRHLYLPSLFFAPCWLRGLLPHKRFLADPFSPCSLRHSQAKLKIATHFCSRTERQKKTLTIWARKWQSCLWRRQVWHPRLRKEQKQQKGAGRGRGLVYI